MLNLNKPIKVAQPPKLTNQSVLNSALVIEMVNNFVIESKKNFGCLRKRGILQPKKLKNVSEKYICTKFC